MRLLILIALLFAFTAGSYADVAYASASSHSSAHSQVDQNDDLDSEPCHSEQNQSQCDDCCCVHSHSMTAPIAQTKTMLDINKQSIVALADRHHSAEISGLKRPPRL